MMVYKKYNPGAFSLFADYGMRVSPIDESAAKWKLGVKLGFLNLITVAYGIYSVKYVSIPLFLTFRRCTLLTTFLVNYIINRKSPNNRTYLKLFLVTTGAIIAGQETFNRDWFGYFLIWMNNITQSVCNVYFNKVNNDNKVTAFEINFYFAWVGLPILLAYTLYSGEIYLLSDILETGNPTDRFNFMLLVFLSGSLGIAITMSTLLVVTLCSPFALSITGNIKNAISAVFGFMIFDDQKTSPLIVSGILVGFSGSCLYAYDELMNIRAKSKKD